jgi:hypothetical protein
MQSEIISPMLGSLCDPQSSSSSAEDWPTAPSKLEAIQLDPVGAALSL